MAAMLKATLGSHADKWIIIGRTQEYSAHYVCNPPMDAAGPILGPWSNMLNYHYSCVMSTFNCRYITVIQLSFFCQITFIKCIFDVCYVAIFIVDES